MKALDKTKCCVCGDTLNYIVKDDAMPLCEKKECVKMFARFFGRFCQAIDQETGMDTNGFFYGKKLIRYDHFDEDFDKAWEKRKK